MVLGTDNSPFVIALPRNESARIMKLEQDSDMLKLERDNLMDKLEILKKNISEIMQNTNELEGENNKLINMVEKVQDEMNLATPIKPINPSESLNMAPILNNNNINPNINNKPSQIKKMSSNPKPQPKIKPNPQPPKKPSSNSKTSPSALSSFLSSGSVLYAAPADTKGTIFPLTIYRSPPSSFGILSRFSRALISLGLIKPF